MTQIFLVRHGETFWNLEARIQGHLDSPLTQTGIAQAEAVANRLKSQHFTALYSSDLGRAYETALRISEKNGLPILAKPCLRERNLGIFQGELKQALKTKYPKEFSRYKDSDYAIEKGESIKQLSERTINCLEAIAQKHIGERILVVTHNGVIVSFFKYVVGIPLEAPRRFFSFNSSINIFSYHEQIWRLETWGDSSHLQTIGTVNKF